MNMHSNHVKTISMNDSWNIKTIFIFNSNNNILRRWTTTTTTASRKNKTEMNNKPNQEIEEMLVNDNNKKKKKHWSEQTQMTFIFYYCFDSSGFWIFSSFSTPQSNPLHSTSYEIWSIWVFIFWLVSLNRSRITFIPRFGFEIFYCFYCSFRCICAIFRFKEFFCSFEMSI